MEELRIMLLNAPTSSAPENSNYACFPSINIALLATRVKRDFGENAQVMIMDGSITPISQIKTKMKRFKPHVVGLSALTPTFDSCIKLADFAKNIGAVTILGNDHGALLSKEIMEAHKSVDYIITSDMGDEPFSEFISFLTGERKREEVDSLVYRDKGRIVFNKKKNRSMKNAIIPDLEFFGRSIYVYSENYMKAFEHLHDKRIIPSIINNARGCPNWRRKCEYCSIADLHPNIGRPELFWETALLYYENYGVNLFFEVQDSFFLSQKYIDELIRSKPRRADVLIRQGEIEFMVYANSIHLAQESNMEKLKLLGRKKGECGP